MHLPFSFDIYTQHLLKLESKVVPHFTSILNNYLAWIERILSMFWKEAFQLNSFTYNGAIYRKTSHAYIQFTIALIMEFCMLLYQVL